MDVLEIIFSCFLIKENFSASIFSYHYITNCMPQFFRNSRRSVSQLKCRLVQLNLFGWFSCYNVYDTFFWKIYKNLFNSNIYKWNIASVLSISTLERHFNLRRFSSWGVFWLEKLLLEYLSSHSSSFILTSIVYLDWSWFSFVSSKHIISPKLWYKLMCFNVLIICLLN